MLINFLTVKQKLVIYPAILALALAARLDHEAEKKTLVSAPEVAGSLEPVQPEDVAAVAPKTNTVVMSSPVQVSRNVAAYTYASAGPDGTGVGMRLSLKLGSPKP